MRPVEKLRAIDYALPVASAQVKSAILLAGLYADGVTMVTEPAPTRDHTERMLRSLGAVVRTDDATGAASPVARTLHGAQIDVPGDFSSAAFFLVAGCLAASDGLVIENVGINPTRTGLLDILRLMGADIRLHPRATKGAEPVADIELRQSALHGIRVPEALVPLAIDEFPVLFIAAAAARGETVVTGAAELRVKESDRLAVMAAGLTAVGVENELATDGIRIEGGQRLRGAQIDSHGDHRIAMAFAVASLRADAPIEIRDVENVGTSFPRFVETARGCGLDLVESETDAWRLPVSGHRHRRSLRIGQRHHQPPDRHRTGLAPAGQRRAVSSRRTGRYAGRARRRRCAGPRGTGEKDGRAFRRAARWW